MRGYFGIGVEGLSKPVNASNLFRSAHAFGASFIFTIEATYAARDAALDTSRAIDNMPYYHWEKLDEMVLPKGCVMVGIELTDDAVELPSFKHPPAAAYVLGRERGSISAPLQARCAHIVKIPAKFCVNVAVAGAIVMYDRMLTLGRHAPRPVTAKPHRWGAPISRKSDES